MFSNITIENYIHDIKDMINFYLNLDEDEFKKLHVIFSKSNTKVPCWNVSMAPIVTCPNCKHCQKFCYDMKAAIQYAFNEDMGKGTGKGVMRARAINTAIWMRDPDRYFAEIEKKIANLEKRSKRKFFRVHVGGDCPNMDYVERLCEVVARHPGMTVWTYTKAYAFWNRAFDLGLIPRNLKVMFSIWKEEKDGEVITYPCPNPHGFPTYEVRMPIEKAQGLKLNGWHCTGDCAICLDLGRGCPVGESSWVDLH